MNITTHGGTTDASDKQPGVVTIGSKDLLDCALVELIARRGAAEMEGVRARRSLDAENERGWQCRAAGLAEAIAVCQMFKNAAQSNEPS